MPVKSAFPPWYYRHRGWILLLPLVALLGLRAAAETPLRWSVLPVIFAAMLLRAWAGRHLGPHGNGADMEAPALARTGPYAFSRHPLYLANIVSGVGLVLFANVPAHEALPLIALILLHHFALARFEEKALREEHPDYEDYAQNTPRWFGLKPPDETPGALSAEANEERIDRDENRAHPAPQTPQARNLLYGLAGIVLVWGAERLSTLW